MTEARKIWEMEKKERITLNLQKTTDKDIIDFLDTKVAQGATKNGLIKDGLRLLIEKEKQDI